MLDQGDSGGLQRLIEDNPGRSYIHWRRAVRTDCRRFPESLKAQAKPSSIRDPTFSEQHHHGTCDAAHYLAAYNAACPSFAKQSAGC